MILWYEGSGTGDRRWLYHDERGSTVAIGNASGAAVSLNSYDEFGVPAPGNAGRFQYTGQAWLPEIGMYNYKARIYAPGLGRFLQTDPVGYADGPNLYAYVGNDSLNYVDDAGTGRQWVGWAVKLSATGMKVVSRVGKEGAVKLRRAGENILARSRQKAREIEVAAHGERDLLKHDAHPGEGRRPHFQTDGKRGHTFWAGVSASVLGLAAASWEKSAEAAQAISAQMEDKADIVAELSDPIGLLMSPSVPPEEGAIQLPILGLWYTPEKSTDQKEKSSATNETSSTGSESPMMKCTGTRIPRDSC